MRIKIKKKKLKPRTWTKPEIWLAWEPAPITEPFKQACKSQGVAAPDEAWKNNRYVVHLRRIQDEETGFVLTHLSIRNTENTPIRSWRDFQRIKNELVGPEFEGCELYPAESRLIDDQNQYHLYVLPKGSAFPFGAPPRTLPAMELTAGPQL